MGEITTQGDKWVVYKYQERWRKKAAAIKGPTFLQELGERFP
jgi:hypothetical protein